MCQKSAGRQDSSEPLLPPGQHLQAVALVLHLEQTYLPVFELSSVDFPAPQDRRAAFCGCGDGEDNTRDPITFNVSFLDKGHYEAVTQRCSTLTYELLTGGSGIQWPCNDTYPLGKERLYEHGQFFTDIEYCESFGHDLETGAPYTKEQYALWNPAGRAVLKASDYLAPIEQPTDEFPLMLSTGRRVHQFHTRTKTGRAPALQKACPAPQTEVSAEDAANANVSDGENVIVRSPRGAVEMPATISNISKGQTFIPFHFGYWDAPDDRARAANELTMERWDPVSKQPLFKAGVIRIEKCVTREDGTSLHAKEEHTATKIKLQQRGATEGKVIDAAPREAHLGFWLCSAVESISQLDSAYTNLIPVLLHDLEIQTGLRVLQRITPTMPKRSIAMWKGASPLESKSPRLRKTGGIGPWCPHPQPRPAVMAVIRPKIRRNL